MNNEPEWIKWEGLTGVCPVPAGHDVAVRFDDGTVCRNKLPEGWDWRYGQVYPFGANIIAYRDWTEFKQQQEEKKMNGYKLKQQSAHPAAALAEQINNDAGALEQGQDLQQVLTLIDNLTKKEQIFALGYLSAKVSEVK